MMVNITVPQLEKIPGEYPKPTVLGEYAREYVSLISISTESDVKKTTIHCN